MTDWLLVGINVGVMLAAVAVAAVMLWPGKKLVTTSQGDVVVKSDSAEFRAAVAEGVDKRLEEKAEGAKAAAAAKAEREAKRKARKKFSEPWVCPKCGSGDSTVSWTGVQKVYIGPGHYYADPYGFGHQMPTYELADLDVLDVKCERCGYCDQFNPLDAK